MGVYKFNGEKITSLRSVLDGADVVLFGDSNIYYTAGNTLSDVGSIFQRLSEEFDIKSWTNLGLPGKTTWQVWLDFKIWATDENVSAYNKESTVFLFGSATNDILSSWSSEYNGNEYSTTASNAVHFISELISEKFPKASYHWMIPTETDWSKWTGSTEADERNMAEKMPYIIKRLEEVQFPYYDAYHRSGITSDMLSDGVHWGGGGYDYTTIATYKIYIGWRDYLINPSSNDINADTLEGKHAEEIVTEAIKRAKDFVNLSFNTYNSLRTYEFKKNTKYFIELIYDPSGLDLSYVGLFDAYINDNDNLVLKSLSENGYYIVDLSSESFTNAFTWISTLDQTYNPNSDNAQSGKAVAQAINAQLGNIEALLAGI